MPLRIRKDAKGETLLSIDSFSADELRRLGSSADSEPTPCGDTVQSLRDRLHEVMRDAGTEIDCLRQELAAERRCSAAFRTRLAQVSGQKAAPAGWLWWPTLIFALLGIITAARIVAEIVGWL